MSSKVRRETIPDSKIKGQWGPWVHALSPVRDKKSGWFTRDVEALSKAVLPTTGGGVYEIAIVPHVLENIPDWENKTVVYLGRATKVNKPAKGKTLRARIFSQHCIGASNLRGPMDIALGSGQHVYFRWQQLKQVKECCARELELLIAYDYAWDRQQNKRAQVRVTPQTVQPPASERVNKWVAIFKDAFTKDEQLAALRLILNLNV